MRRGLATATQHELGLATEQFVPWENSSASKREHNSKRRQSQRAPYAYGLDLNPPPLILQESSFTITDRLPYSETTSGDLKEIHQNLHACLRVGRLDRAGVLLNRLRDLYKTNAPGLVAAHQDYLRALTLQSVRSKDPHRLQETIKWFEVEMRRPRMPLDAPALATIIQAIIHCPQSSKTARMLRRYSNLAQELHLNKEVEQLVPRLSEILSDIQKDVKQPTKGAMEALELVQFGTPSIRAVDEQSLGLVTLKSALSTIKQPDNSPQAPLHIDEATIDLSADPDIARQQNRERNAIGAALNRWRAQATNLKKIGINGALARPDVGSLMWSWHEAMLLAIKTEILQADAAEKKQRCTAIDKERLQCAPYLQLVTPEKLSAITILTCLSEVPNAGEDGSGVKIATLLHSIGRAVENECNVSVSQHPSAFERWRTLSKRGRRQNPARESKQVRPVSQAESTKLEAQNHTHDPWSSHTKVQIGAVLFSLLADVAQVEVSRQHPTTGLEVRESQPVFFHTFQYRKGKAVGIVRLSSVMTEKLSREPIGSSLARQAPMLTMPKPWTGYRNGGYLEQPYSVVRASTNEPFSRRYVQTACENGDMKQVFAGLDVLGRTPWRINDRVFETMTQAWNCGDPIADIPAQDPKLELSPEPDRAEGAAARRKWHKKAREAEDKVAGLRSQRSYINYQLETARAFVDEVFYFPHNVDFRGRAYPMTPFLNHMGADNVRGLLTFAHGKELGETGLWWLKVHLANVYGYDKANFTERFTFTEQHLEDIADSAAKPLGGRRWWLRAEDPWQCLAACFELTAALRTQDPTKFLSHIPIHQDGTCNGLQHYAALGGDVAGAKQVNLEPGDRPADIYSAVAELIEKEIGKDAANGDELASHLNGRITRKVVKQTVMTNVYGVTLIGARAQVRRQLAAILVGFPDTPSVNLNSASLYVVRKIFKTLATMFNGAHDIQYWLGDCGRRICDSLSPAQLHALELEGKGKEAASELKDLNKRLQTYKTAALTSFMSPIVWTTPLKMPVVQPYRQETARPLTTRLQTISLNRPNHLQPVDKARQLQAFPPNFIHSLDGTHMFLTAHRCDALGLTFAAVHDSFWTHAADVDTMNRVTREAFIRMHSEDIVARLASEMKIRYRGHLHKVSLRSDSALGKQISKWRATTARKRKVAIRDDSFIKYEIMLETKRLRLLKSPIRERRQEGQLIVTPASLYAARKPRKHGVVPARDDPKLLGETNVRKQKLLADEQLTVGNLENAETIEPEEGTIEDDTLSNDTSDMDSNSAAEHETQTSPDSTTKSKAASAKSKTWAWLPLVFPPVPKRGEFDVTKLKDSLYFFS